MPQDFPTTEAGEPAKDQYNPSVLLLDDCEGTLKWSVSGTGSGYGITKGTSYCYFGSNGYELKTRTTSAADGDLATIIRRLCYPEGTTLYWRMRIAPYDPSKIEAMRVLIHAIDGTRDRKAAIEIRPNTADLRYLDSAGAYQTVAGYAWNYTTQYWYILEFSLNLSTWVYGSVKYGGVESDLSAFAFQNVGADTDRQISVEIQVEANGAAKANIFMDALYLADTETL